MTKGILLFLIILTAWTFSPAVAHAQTESTPATPTTNQFQIKLTTDRNESGRALGYRALMEYRGRKYTAVMPMGYRVLSSEAQKRFVGYHSDNSCSLTVAFWPAAQLEDDQKFDHDFLRWWIEEQSNNGNITSETWGMCLGKRVPIFDVNWVTQSELRQSTRISFIPLDDAIIEVSLMSNPESFKLHCFTHSDLLGSLRMSGKNGKLEITPLSDKY